VASPFDLLDLVALTPPPVAAASQAKDELSGIRSDIEALLPQLVSMKAPHLVYAALKALLWMVPLDKQPSSTTTSTPHFPAAAAAAATSVFDSFPAAAHTATHE
jgi:hypothetical protein